MKNKVQRLKCLLLTCCMVLGLALPAGKAEVRADASRSLPELLAEFTFDDEASGFEGGGAKATKHGTYSLEDGIHGKALSLNGNSANYLSVTKTDGSSLLTGKENITITFNSKVANNNTAWPFFAAPNAVKQEFGVEKYLGVLENTGVLTVERYNNTGARPAVLTGNAPVNVWKHVAVAVDETGCTLYIDGVGSRLESAYKLSDILGNSSIFQIGHANWGDAGEGFHGLIDNFAIYDGVLSKQDVMGLYLENSETGSIQAYLDRAAESLNLNKQLLNGKVVADLQFPQEHEYVKVEWSSNTPAVITNDGKVSAPDTDTEVTLTAALKAGGLTAVREFKLPVISRDHVAQVWEEEYTIPYTLTPEDVLPITLGEGTITWSGDSSVREDGTIVPDFSGEKRVTLTAELNYDGEIKSKQFKNILFDNDADYILAYTRTPLSTNVRDEFYSVKLAYSLHIAHSEDGNHYTPLNYNQGVLFARGEGGTTVTENIRPKGIKNPYIFYLEDGTFGIIAVRTHYSGSPDTADGGSGRDLLLFTSENLYEFEEVGFISLNTDKQVDSASCEYDPARNVYKIVWADANGDYFENTIADIESLNGADLPQECSPYTMNTADTGITGAVESNFIPVSNRIGTKVKTKLSPLENTDMEVPDQVTARTAEEVQDITATAHYNDGSTLERKVSWNTSNVKWNEPGNYEVTGTIRQDRYSATAPLIAGKADPQVIKYQGSYYFIATHEQGQNVFYIRKSDSIAGLARAQDHNVMNFNTYPDMFDRCFWAPELHEIDGSLYMFFAATNEGGYLFEQAYVMKLKENGDPLAAADWERPQIVVGTDGEPIYPARSSTRSTTGITLDMTYFEVGETSYIMWSQGHIRPVDTGSWIYIATVNKERPWIATSEPVLVCQPAYGWSNNSETFVVEGPFVLHTEDKVFITFSGGATNKTYSVGILSADRDADLLDPNAWKEGNYPILTSAHVEGEYGPGHNAYVVDDNGYVMNIYHTRFGVNGERSAAVRRVHFDIDGMPVLDMTEERDVKIRTVTMTVVVPDPDVETAQAVIDLIHNIGTVTRNSKAKIDAAFKAYHELSDAQKKLVTNYAALEKARNDYDKLVAQDVVELIRGIGTVTKDSKTKIDAAVKAYQALTAEQKKLVVNYSVLQAAQNTYQELINEKPNPPLPQKGTKVTVGDYQYQITKSAAKNGTVTVVKPKNKNIRKVKIKSTVKINNYTFKITAVKKKAFSKKSKITSVSIGNNVRTIGAQAFEGCKKLTKVTIGKNVKTIGKNAFKGSSKLKNLTIKSTKLKSIKNGAFKGTAKNATAKVPKKYLDAYKKKLLRAGLNKKSKIKG